MKITRKLLLTTAFAALLGVGAFAGVASAKSNDAKPVEAANNTWESVSFYYSSSSQINGKIAVNRGGVPSGSAQWEDENMTYTNRRCGSNYVYSATAWEYYGGFDEIYFKDGDNPLHHISGWTTRDTMSGKMYDGQNWQTIYTIDFNMNSHGTAPDGQYVISGGKVTQPSAPTASGYTFGGWYKEAACTNAWNFSSDTVTSNKTLYAKWTAIVTQYTVTLYKVLDGASPVSISSEKVNSGTVYAVPGNRYEAGYEFGGWYTTADCSSAYSAKAINANTGIYAKYTHHGNWAGTINIDLRDAWYDAEANYAIYLMNKDSYEAEVGDWSSYVMNSAANERLVQVPYSVGFEPTDMYIFRYNPNYSQSSWNSDKTPTGSNKWGQSIDVDFSEMVRVGAYDDVAGKNNAYTGFPKLHSNEGGSWNDSIVLGEVKSNGSHHVEHYSTNVVLTAGTQFKVKVAPYASGDFYATFSTHNSIKSNFSGDGTNNITVVTGGTYAFYVDSVAKAIYITKVELAEADEWAQYFLSHVGCDETGATLPTGWGDCATRYGNLSGAAKNIIYGAKADEKGEYVEQAMARYDHAVKAHPTLNKFVVNSSSEVRAAAYIYPAVEAINGSGSTIAIVAITSVSLVALGGYFLFKKKHQ